MLLKVRDSHSRSAVKAISWRILGSLDTLLLSYLFTGSLVIAGSIASTESITKIVLYYFHERAWSRFSWGREGDESSGADANLVQDSGLIARGTPA